MRPLDPVRPNIYRLTRSSRANVVASTTAMIDDPTDQVVATAEARPRTGVDVFPVQRGQPLVARCPRCKIEHRTRAQTVLDLAGTARREGSTYFMLP